MAKKDEPEVISEEATKAAEEEAEKMDKKAKQAAEDRKKKEAAGEKLSGIKAIFRRASFPYETGEGDKTYSEGEEVIFDTYQQYYRWFRRGACETEEDRQVRIRKETAKKARELLVQQGG